MKKIRNMLKYIFDILIKKRSLKKRALKTFYKDNIGTKAFISSQFEVM